MAERACEGSDVQARTAGRRGPLQCSGMSWAVSGGGPGGGSGQPTLLKGPTEGSVAGRGPGLLAPVALTHR